MYNRIYLLYMYPTVIFIYLFIFLKSICFIYLFIYGCVGSSFLCEGFL